MQPNYYPSPRSSSSSALQAAQRNSGNNNQTMASSPITQQMQLQSSPVQPSMVRPPFSPREMNPFMPMGIAPGQAPFATAFGVQRFPFPGAPMPAGSGMTMAPRAPIMFAPTDPRFGQDPTLRSLQERVAQVAVATRLPMQDMATFAPHITPRGDARGHFQELTHLNPRGSVRAQPYLLGAKLHGMDPSAAMGVQQDQEVQQFLQFAAHSKSAAAAAAAASPLPAVSPSSSKRSLETEEDDSIHEDAIPELEDPDGKKSVEEWKKFRLRVMSRLRKQRWRAKKKAEVLAGIENTKLEEEERLRRDRIRKQQQRAKKRQRMLEEQVGQQATSSSSDPARQTEEAASEGESISGQQQQQEAETTEKSNESQV